MGSVSITAAALVAQLAGNPACSHPGMALEFWPKVVRVESRYHPFALHDDTENRSFYPEKIEVAEAMALTRMRAGHSVGVGLSQLTSSSPDGFYRKFGMTVREALDACRNMAAGAEHYVMGALSVYNTGSRTAGMAYAQKVLSGVSVVGSHHQVPSSPMIEDDEDYDDRPSGVAGSPTLAIGD